MNPLARLRRSAPVARSAYRLASVIVLLAWPPASSAQVSPTAVIRGVVLDETGAVLPDVSLTLTNTETTAIATTVSKGDGGWEFGGVFTGPYRLRAERLGFRTVEQAGLVLSPQDVLYIEVRLPVRGPDDRVLVSSASEKLRSDTGAREHVIRADQLETLPSLARSAIELVRILPGVVAPPPSSLETIGLLAGSNKTDEYTINGVRSSANVVLLDGASLTDFGCNCRSAVTLNPDMVQDVKIQSSNYAAEHGSAGIAISAVTKSGGSNFHGGLYYHDRDYHLSSNDRSNSLLGLPKPKSEFRFPGGTLGGPLVIPGWAYSSGRDRLFFFTGVERQRQRLDLGTVPTVVPTLEQRRGLFTESLITDGQNLGQPVGPVLIPPGYADAGLPAPGADIGPYIHPLGRTLADLYPAPTGRYRDNRFNYAAPRVQPLDRLLMRIRLDWNLSAATKAYLTVAREREQEEDAYGAWGPTSDVPLPSPADVDNTGRSAAAQIVTVLSRAMTNEVLVTWSGTSLRNSYADPSAVSLAAKGVQWTSAFPGASPSVPGVVANWSGGMATLADPFNETYSRRVQWQAADRLTRVAGAHTLKAGVAAARLDSATNTANDAAGTLVFTPWTPQGTGNIVGDLLTGRPFTFSQGTRGVDGRFREWHLDAFAQDSWRPLRNLTLEFGVRGGYWSNDRELHGQGAYFDPARYQTSEPQLIDTRVGKRLNGFCYVADGCAAKGILPARTPFVLPRLNAAWDLTGEGTRVIRGGYGVFVNRPVSNIAEDNTLLLPPAATHVTLDAFGAAALGGGVGLNYDTAAEAAAVGISDSTITSVTPRSFRFPKTHSFSIAYAARIPFGQTIDAAYVGTRGRSLMSSIEGNAVPEGALSRGVIGNADLSVPVNRMALDGSAVNAFRPFPAYSNLLFTDFEGVSDYDSMQLTLSRPAGGRLHYTAVYTLGRTRGTFGDDYSKRDPFDARRTYGVSQSDRTHTLTMSWHAVLPDFARGALDRGAGRAVLNGWQVSGISTVVSGTPIWLRFAGQAGDSTVLLSYFGTPDIWGPIGPSLAPVYTCDPRRGGTRVGEKVLDIGCLALPPFGDIGQPLPPYNIRRPTRSNHDLALSKRFSLAPSHTLEFRASVFNLFNTAYATDIDTMLAADCNVFVDHVPNGADGYADHVCDPTAGFHFTDATRHDFGTVVSMTGHRVVQLALKYTF